MPAVSELPDMQNITSFPYPTLKGIASVISGATWRKESYITAEHALHVLEIIGSGMGITDQRKKN